MMMNSISAVRSEMEKPQSSQDKIFDIVFAQDDLNWKDLIYDLVRQEGMDPWNINVSLLAEKFLRMLNKLKKMDFRVSGKMVLTASLLLKIKSDKLLQDGIQGLDDLINGIPEDDSLEEGFEYEQYDLKQFLNDQKKIIPRTPQPRERKVSVFDLVNALEQALDIDLKRQRVLSRQNENKDVVRAPVQTFDLSAAMEQIQINLQGLFKNVDTKVFFTDLVPSNTKKDIVYTFLPLLHLENQQKVGLIQKEHFGDIEVRINEKINAPLYVEEESTPLSN